MKPSHSAHLTEKELELHVEGKLHGAAHLVADLHLSSCLACTRRLHLAQAAYAHFQATFGQSAPALEALKNNNELGFAAGGSGDLEANLPCAIQGLSVTARASDRDEATHSKVVFSRPDIVDKTAPAGQFQVQWPGGSSAPVVLTCPDGIWVGSVEIEIPWPEFRSLIAEGKVHALQLPNAGR